METHIQWNPVSLCNQLQAVDKDGTEQQSAHEGLRGEYLETALAAADSAAAVGNRCQNCKLFTRIKRHSVTKAQEDKSLY